MALSISLLAASVVLQQLVALLSAAPDAAALSPAAGVSSEASSGQLHPTYGKLTPDEVDKLIALSNAIAEDETIEDLAQQYRSKSRQGQHPSALLSAILAADRRQQLAKRRAHIFVGKKSSGTAAENLELQRLIGDNEDDVDEMKRSRMFVGKRPSAVDDDLTALYDDAEMTADKRPRMFVGKKYAPVFVGKRSADDRQARP